MLHSLFLFQGYSWTTIPQSYCNVNWDADWKRKTIKTVDDCKALCENTADCTTIVHGTYRGISNNCALCTDNNLRSYNGLWSTTYVWSGTNPHLFIFLFITTLGYKAVKTACLLIYTLLGDRHNTPSTSGISSTSEILKSPYIFGGIGAITLLTIAIVVAIILIKKKKKTVKSKYKASRSGNNPSN